MYVKLSVKAIRTALISSWVYKQQKVSHLCPSDAPAYLYIRTLASELPH